MLYVFNELHGWPGFPTPREGSAGSVAASVLGVSEIALNRGRWSLTNEPHNSKVLITSQVQEADVWYF